MAEIASGPLRQRFAIIRAAAQLGRDGQLKRGMDKQEAAGLIAAQLVTDDPKTYADPGFDLQSLIDLIIQLLPLIFLLFGV